MPLSTSARVFVWDPNPTLDVALKLRRLAVGMVHYADEQAIGVGGKGSLTLRTLTALDVDAAGRAPIAGHIGSSISAVAASMHLPMAYDEVTGESRVAVTLADDDLVDTNVNGPGPISTGAEWDGHINAVCSAIAATRPEWVIVAGRPPLGPDDAGVRRVLSAASASGASSAVDMAEPRLSHALHAAPTLTKINRREAAQLLRLDPTTPTAELARGVAMAGAETAIVTDGSASIGVAHRDPASDGLISLTAQPPAVRVRSAIGCGDCFLGGFVAALSESPKDVPGALVRATALASAAAETLLPGDFVRVRALELARVVKVSRAP